MGQETAGKKAKGQHLRVEIQMAEFYGPDSRVHLRYMEPLQGLGWDGSLGVCEDAQNEPAGRKERP